MESLCTYYIQPPDQPPTALHELKNGLQTTDLVKKSHVMEELLRSYSQPDHASSCLMPVIKFVSGYAHDHRLIKLTHLFWECLPDQDSSLTLLISQLIRNELQSPNEYVRGACLRNLSKIFSSEILRTVDEVILENLAHSHGYVRRNCCLCIASLGARFPGIFDDAIPTLINMALYDDDKSAQQHAMRAVSVLSLETAYDKFIADQKNKNITVNPDVYHMAVVELITLCWEKTKAFPPRIELVKLIDKQCLLTRLRDILESTGSNAVRLSAIKAVVWLSSKPEDLFAAAKACVDILNTHTNQDVKHHVLSLLAQIESSQPEVIEHIAIDVLRTIESSSTELADKAINLAVPHVTVATVNGALEILKIQLLSGTNKKEQGLLLKGMRQLCGRYPTVALGVIELLLDFLSENQNSEVISLVRELVVCSKISEESRENIMCRLTDCLVEREIHSGIIEQCVYLIGEFARSEKSASLFIHKLVEALGPLPFPDLHGSSSEQSDSKAQNSKVVVKTVILPDGSYGTENVLVDEGKTTGLRKCIISDLENTNLLSIIGLAVCKIVLSNREIFNKEPSLFHQGVLIVASLYKLSQQNGELGKKNLIEKRLGKVLNVLCRCGKECESIRRGMDEQLVDLVLGERETDRLEDIRCVMTIGEDVVTDTKSVDDEIVFFQSYDGLSQFNPGASKEASLQGKQASAKLGGKAIPLSGFSDPIYVEAYVRMNHLDLICDLLLHNQTDDTLANATVNLGTHGDLKILDVPKAIHLQPGECGMISATIRLSSTEAGLMFGFCVYERAIEKNHFPLSELQVDLLDCLETSWIGNTTFRRLWTEFEWENKIAISVPCNDSSQDCLTFLEMLLKQSKMTIVGIKGDYELLTNSLSQKSNDQYIKEILDNEAIKLMASNGVFAINFCTRSIFGEDALVNLSLELQDKKIVGTTRIRSRTQGIALSLGDRVSQSQRAFAAQLACQTLTTAA